MAKSLRERMAEKATAAGAPTTYPFVSWDEIGKDVAGVVMGTRTVTFNDGRSIPVIDLYIPEGERDHLEELAEESSEGCYVSVPLGTAALSRWHHDHGDELVKGANVYIRYAGDSTTSTGRRAKEFEAVIEPPDGEDVPF